MTTNLKETTMRTSTAAAIGAYAAHRDRRATVQTSVSTFTVERVEADHG